MKVIEAVLADNRYRRIFWYLISGGTAALVDLVVLAALVDIFHWWYITATTIAFVVAFLVSFFMQKTFTFQNLSNDRIHKQLTAYLFINLCNLGVNAFLMYVMVDFGHINYLVGQIIVAIGIAFYSFFLYKHVIFRPTTIS